MKFIPLLLIALVGWIVLPFAIIYNNFLAILIIGFTGGFGTYWFFVDKGRIDNLKKEAKRSGGKR